MIRMRPYAALLVFALLAACGKKEQPPATANTSSAATAAASQSAADPMPDNPIQQFAWHTREIKRLLARATPTQADSLYEQHLAKTTELLEKINRQEDSLLDNYYSDAYWETGSSGAVIRPTPVMQAKQEELAAAGLQFWDVGETIVIVRPVPDYYYKLFGSTVSPDYRDYLAITAEQEKNLDIVDASVAVSWQELGNRVHAWEDFIRQYPNSKLAANARIRYADYQRVYLTGADNSPVFDENGFDPHNNEARTDWQRYRREYPQSATAALIAKMPELAQTPADRRWDAFSQMQKAELGYTSDSDNGI